MASKTFTEPSRIGNPKNEKFKNLGEMNPDVAEVIGENTLKWIQLISFKHSERSEHFGVREQKTDVKGER